MARRQPREISRSRRRPARRDPYDRVLIVCEGTETEPHYFREVVEAYRLNTANVVVRSGATSDPRDVVATAQEAYSDDPDYEGVYVVADGDVETFGQARAAVREIQRGDADGLGAVLSLVASVPCFEYWLLLHFQETAKPYHKEGARSACADCERDLKTHLPDYSKGARGVFAKTREHLDVATHRAEVRLRRRTTVPNPGTRVHELVERLRTLKDTDA